MVSLGLFRKRTALGISGFAGTGAFRRRFSPEPHHHPLMTILVLARDTDRVVFDCSPREAEELLRRRQAERLFPGSKMLRLCGMGEPWKCRTRTARPNPILAACGRSQVYTEATPRGVVHGFKSIYPEDLPVFRSAVYGTKV